MRDLWEHDQARKTHSRILSADSAVQEVQSPLRLSLLREEYDEITGTRVNPKRFDVGFTGTRKGMPGDQAATVLMLLEGLVANNHADEHWAHHGDCDGSDAQFESLATAVGYLTHAHPRDKEELRAYCRSTIIDEPVPSAARNLLIVRYSRVLLATPAQVETHGSQIYSGTWQTVRMARNEHKPVAIIYDDGRIEYERWH